MTERVSIVCVDTGLCDLCRKRPAFGIPLCEKCFERLNKEHASKSGGTGA